MCFDHSSSALFKIKLNDDTIGAIEVPKQYQKTMVSSSLPENENEMQDLPEVPQETEENLRMFDEPMPSVDGALWLWDPW